MSDDYSFGDWVKRRRKALDLTQQDLAQQVGCSASAIHKIEADERRPSRQIAELLARCLQVPAEQRDLFLKVARQQKSVLHLGSLAPLSIPQPVPTSIQFQANLPHPLTSLIGREHELHMVVQQLQDTDCRLLTLTGPGGVGKTRLALEAAHRLRDTFDHGVCFVSLVGTSASEFIIPAIAEALKFAFSGAGELKLQLFNFLQGRTLLLVLDNLEHLLAGIELLAELLACAPGVKLLTTSREPLNLRPEWVFEVQGLPVPTQVDLSELAANSAVTLFLQRARHSRADFNPNEEDLLAIKRICAQVEGLPLGLELAASWVRMLSCREIAQEIEREIDFLTAAARDVPARHRSIRAVFDSSWSLLSDRERGVMQRLSVFRGGLTRQAAETVAGAPLALLSALVDKSLVRASESGRYDLHELIRQYARQQLVESGELEEACGRHLEFFLALAEEASANLRGADQLAWLNRLEQDHDNLRAALEWSLRHESKLSAVEESEARLSLRLAGALYLYWKMRMHWGEGRKWLQRALAQAANLGVSPERARALEAAALLAVEQADTRAARQLAEESLALARELGDSGRLGRALYALGMVLWKQKEFAGARACCAQALDQFRELGDRASMTSTLRALGRIAINQDDLAAAQSYLDECYAIFREYQEVGQLEFNALLSDLGLLAYLCGDFSTARSHLEISLKLFRQARIVSGIEMSLNRLGDIARCENDYDEAERCYTESLAVYREAGDKDEIPSLLHNLGYVAKQRGDYPKALALFREGLVMHAETGNQAGIAECLAGVAAVLSAQGQAERGARLFGAAEILREKADAVLWPANRIEYDRSLALLQDALEDATLTAAWAAGRSLSIEQALAEANHK